MQSPPAAFAPYRKRACRMTMSSPEMMNVPSLNPMPSPGAVCPAMVTFELASVVLFTWMCPLTSKTIVRPAAGTVAMASANEPAPELFKFVT